MLREIDLNTIGLPNETKENERRRALLYHDIPKVRNVSQLCFEEGYLKDFGIEDSKIIALGARVVSKDEVYECDIICKAKAPSKDEYALYKQEQTLFCWLHAVQRRSIVDLILEKKMTGIAWEDMYVKGRHVFWRNNEISGEAAVAHAALQHGSLPETWNVALIGRGNAAIGAHKMLSKLGARVTIYNRTNAQSLSIEIDTFDVVVNAVLWDVFRDDHLVYEEDIKRMKPGSMVIDVSCDEGMGVETSKPTSIENPVYWKHGVLHYVVDHTPALLYRTASESISKEVCMYLDDLIEEKDNLVLTTATVIKDGIILDEKTTKFQNR